MEAPWSMRLTPSRLIRFPNILRGTFLHQHGQPGDSLLPLLAEKLLNKEGGLPTSKINPTPGSYLLKVSGLIKGFKGVFGKDGVKKHNINSALMPPLVLSILFLHAQLINTSKGMPRWVWV